MGNNVWDAGAGATFVGLLPMETLGRFGHIFYFVVLPVLLLASIGWLLQRRLGLHMATLTRLNFHFVIPGMVYYSVVHADISGADLFLVLMFAAGMMAALAVVTYVAAIVRKVPKELRNAMMMTVIFNNSGNYALPLQELAFRPAVGEQAGLDVQPAKSTPGPDDAFMVQIFYMIFQNVTGFTIGILLAAGGHGRASLRDSLGHMLRFPSLYALLAGVLTVYVRGHLTEDQVSQVLEAASPFVQVLDYVRGAFFAIALCTLGAQLATVGRGQVRYPVKLSVLLRLLGGPIVGLLIIYAFGINGFLAQVLLISTSTPAAVNAMLLCLQFDNHPDFAARAVLYSTFLSPITVTLVIYLARSDILPGFAF